MATARSHHDSPAPANHHARGHQPIREQARTYAGFLHLTRWFGYHMIPIIAGIFLLLSEQHLLGVLFLLVGVGVLIRGIVSVRKTTGRIVRP